VSTVRLRVARERIVQHGGMTTRDAETPHGLARVHLHAAERPRGGALVLGHGAGGGVNAPDLQAATRAGLAEGFTVALVEQPYRVAGRRSPAPARQLDAAWIAVVESLRAGELEGLSLVTGGRSAGARVACRTVEDSHAVGVLCLAFPLRPPRGSQDRLPELNAVTVPTLVVQGTTDPFGIPPEAAGRTVAQVAGDHGLKKDLDGVEDAVRGWLARLV
jgi:uncharacterized protein